MITQTRKRITMLAVLGGICALTPLQAEIFERQLLLEKRQSFLEMHPGVFLRADAINHIEAKLILNGDPRRRSLRDRPLEKSFSLDASGIKALKAYREEQKGETGHRASITIAVDGEEFCIVTTNGKDPLEIWEEFAAAAGRAVDQLEKLITVASGANKSE